MLRFTTAGESHGSALVSILEGAPAGILETNAPEAASDNMTQKNCTILRCTNIAASP